MAPQPRTRAYDVNAVIGVLNEILAMELATVVYYTHYSFMVYGHARIPVVEWMRSQATESLTHAQGAGDMILRLEGKPEMGTAPLPATITTRSTRSCRRQWCARPMASTSIASCTP